LVSSIPSFETWLSLIQTENHYNSLMPGSGENYILWVEGETEQEAKGYSFAEIPCME